MSDFLRRKSKILFICFFVLLTCTACSTPRGKDGKVKVDQIISSETIQVKRKDVSIDSVSDSKLKKQYQKLDPNDTITIKPTTFSQAFSTGWFDGLIVWPMAMLINKISAATDAGIGIIITTLLVQMIVFALTGKSQMSSQRMQEIQPEITKIQNKYKGKTDQESQMKMYQETQTLYAKYDIHPFGSMLVMFLQLPIMMGMYYATMRAYEVLVGYAFGMRLSTTPMYAIQHLMIGGIIVYALMVVSQLVSTMLPQWLKKWQDKKDNVKKHSYRESEKQNDPMNMNMYMYMMVIIFAFMYLSWPLAMSYYWMICSIIRIVQQYVMHRVMHRAEAK